MSTPPEISQFTWIDFTTFGIMLGLSLVIGVYYGVFGSKQDTVREYLFGGKTMKAIPVALSLIASHVSGVALLSVPADIYVYGGSYGWITVSLLINGVVSYYVFMPVFLKLELSTAYEYLNMRFNSNLRKLASFIYTLSILLINPIAIYVSCIAFSQVTGVNVHYISPAICISCVFYTTIGGLKAVVWSDTIQMISVCVSMITVFILGIISVGGFRYIWEKSLQGQRLDLLDFQVDLTRRDSFWALIIGATINWISQFSICQGTIQRLIAVPTLTDAKKVMIIATIGIAIVKAWSTFTGLIIYAKYFDCDPLLSKQVLRSDQILPYYVMDVAGKIPGLPGLFVAGVFGASLSTLSTNLNTMASTIYEDFVSPLLPHDISQKRASNILKLIVLITGAISTLLVVVIEQMGSVLPLLVTFMGVTGGPLLGIFCLGMLFPKANSKGALLGGTISLITTSWIMIGNQYYKRMGLLEDFSKPLTVEGCRFPVNITMNATDLVLEQPFILYRITFWYYSAIGLVLTIIVGAVVSWFTNKNDSPVHRDLISPVVYFLLPKDVKTSPLYDYYNVAKALNLVTQGAEK